MSTLYMAKDISATLLNLLKEEAGLLHGVSREVKVLCMELESMQCFLGYFEEEQYKLETVQRWIREMRHLAYRAECVVERYAFDVSSTSKVFKKFATMFAKGRLLHKIGVEIGRIRGLKAEMERLGPRLKKKSSITTSEKEILFWIRNVPCCDDSFPVLGMKNDIQELMSLIMAEDRHLEVVSIWGMAGSGKTKVAWKIYHDKKIMDHFDALAWVCITDKCEVTKVLEEIMQQLSGVQAEKWSLVDEFYKLQREKKCLIVLDDIWDAAQWNYLKHVFLLKEARTKILLTTRNKGVVENGFVHELSYLNQDEAWELLQIKAFTGNQDCRVVDEREKIGRTMVDKCGYLPLAISELGPMLRKQNCLHDWEKVNSRIDSCLSRTVDGAGNRVMQICALSYDALPFNLKQCFLCFALFPEDVHMSVSSLYFTWIAQGLIVPNIVGRIGCSLLEVAEQCLTELVNRSMVMVDFSNSSIPGSKYTTCYLHQIMRKVCLMKCLEENFVKVVNFRGAFASPFRVEGPYYRLAIHGNKDVVEDAFAKMSNYELPSMMVIVMDSNRSSKEIVWSWPSKVLQNLKHLRTLILFTCNLDETTILPPIQKLIHLRCVSFSDCWMKKPPLLLLDLPYIQILDFEKLIWDEPAQVADNVVWKAKKLMCLYLPKRRHIHLVNGKLRLTGLNQLQILMGFYTHDMEVNDLAKLSHLQHIRAYVSNSEYLSLFLSCIQTKWQWIRAVELCVDIQIDSNLLRSLFSLPYIYILDIQAPFGKRLPEPVSGSFLTELHLNGFGFRKDPMQMLENLPHLHKLYLESFEAKEMVCNTRSFSQLKILILTNFLDLVNWRIEEGALCKLSTLYIVCCIKLEMIPDELRFIPTLEKLVHSKMPYNFVCRLRESDGEDYGKISHIRHVMPVLDVKFPEGHW